MGWAKSPHICEPLQPLLYWLMLRWLVPPCALAGVNGFCGGTDFAKSAYLAGPRFFKCSPEHGSSTIIVASAVSGMVRDGHSSCSGVSTRSLARSSNHLPLTFPRVYLHGARVLAPPVALSPSVLASPIAPDSIGPRRSSAMKPVVGCRCELEGVHVGSEIGVSLGDPVISAMSCRPMRSSFFLLDFSSRRAVFGCIATRVGIATVQDSISNNQFEVNDNAVSGCCAVWAARRELPAGNGAANAVAMSKTHAGQSSAAKQCRVLQRWRPRRDFSRFSRF